MVCSSNDDEDPNRQSDNLDSTDHEAKSGFVDNLYYK